MIYGIEQTTDMRYPETKIVKFTSRKRALAWLADDQGFAWAGGARHDIPASQQNWHSRIRACYEVVGFRRPSDKKLREEAHRISTPTYRRNAADVLAGEIRSQGERIEWEA
ncbi:MAG: hypothetical protein M0Z92_09355 [Actinomycetota bacterium]|nr:hypothetical protein [Actinomycetota bacterium]